jgi:hypothetical protein
VQVEREEQAGSFAEMENDLTERLEQAARDADATAARLREELAGEAERSAAEVRRVTAERDAARRDCEQVRS